MSTHGPIDDHGVDRERASGPFDAHREAFGAELRRVTPKVKQRRRLRLFTLGGTSLALAAAATAAIVIVPTTGSRLDVLAEAQAAIATTPNSIIHYAARFESEWPQRRVDIARWRGCKADPAETWAATTPGPPRYRVKISMNSCDLHQIGSRLATGGMEIAYADRTEKVYAPSDGFMEVTTDLPAQADEQPRWAMFPIIEPQSPDGVDAKDPVARIRSLLAEGRLTDAGQVAGGNGRKLRRLVGQFEEMRGDPENPKPKTVKLDYRVDAETFAPVRIAVTRDTLVPKDVNLPVRQHRYEHRELTDVTTFSIFEVLPLTKDSERLLTVEPKAGTEVTTEKFDPNAEVEKPSAAEKARAKRITDAQIKAGVRKRAGWW